MKMPLSFHLTSLNAKLICTLSTEDEQFQTEARKNCTCSSVLSISYNQENDAFRRISIDNEECKDIYLEHTYYMHSVKQRKKI